MSNSIPPPAGSPSLPDPDDSGANVPGDTLPSTVSYRSSESESTRSSVLGQIDRYVLLQELGRGGFGEVYLAYDPMTERHVAIKVERPGRHSPAQVKQSLRNEARKAATLDHPNIVPLYNVGEDGDRLFLVYKYIDRIRATTLSPTEAALLVARVGEALACAHRAGIFHRDVKPANILVDKDGIPYLTDFGLAAREHELGPDAPLALGTIPYCPPELCRGEGNRVNERTDIYSLGVVFYELLCGHTPFDPRAVDVLRQIVQNDPPPPRDSNGTISGELERICLKAISRRASARYRNALDFADDLRQAVRAEASDDTNVGPMPGRSGEDGSAPRVRPVGPRSYDRAHSGFFLQLLPLGRLPESIEALKRAIDSREPDETFPVGVINGPSGSGKSSLIKAGLLPLFLNSTSVVPIYVEATPEQTEATITAKLPREQPDRAAPAELPEILARVRRSGGLPGGAKLLIVIDQFEQWLHAHPCDLDHTELYRALSQADGKHVQIIVIVRKEFDGEIRRLFDLLEITLRSDLNDVWVDLFDLQHSREVLHKLGHGYNKLPAENHLLTTDQKMFLEQSVQDLSEDGWVVCVRLSLFAHLMRNRDWTVAALRELGGTAGVGVRFLESLTGRSASPELKDSEKIIRKLLKALVSGGGPNTKGRMHSRAELAEACGLPENSPRFRRLLDHLDRDLYIITPVGRPDVPGTDDRPGDFYQLTHDYLVAPVRTWLGESRDWRERTADRLRSYTLQRQQFPDQRPLPLFTYVTVLLAGGRKRWTAGERKLVQESTRHYRFWAGVALTAALMGVLALGVPIKIAQRAQLANDVTTAVASDPGQLLERLNKLPPGKPTLEQLRTILAAAAASPRSRLHAALGLLLRDKHDTQALDYVLNQMDSVDADECGNLVSVLDNVPAARKRLREDCLASPPDPAKMRKSILLLHLGDRDGAQAMLELRPDPTSRAQFVHDVFPAWHGPLDRLDRAFTDQVCREDDPAAAALRYGICAAIACLDPTQLDSGEQSSLIALLTRLAKMAPDGGTRSAADLALRRLDASVPAVAPTTRAPPGRRWFENSLGMRMVEIPAGTLTLGSGTERRTINVEAPFFLQDREVSIQLISQFYRERKQPSDARSEQYQWVHVDPMPTATSESDPYVPATNLTWYLAIQFCNWVSEREGRRPFYVLTGETQRLRSEGREFDCDVWGTDDTADGYRLPRLAQWQYACAARSATDYFFGNRTDLLPAYGLTALESRTTLDRCASRLPNPWGLFDTHGNATEWCDDAKEQEPTKRDTAMPNLFTGSDRSRTIDQFPIVAVVTVPMLGFRVSCPSETKALVTTQESR